MAVKLRLMRMGKKKQPTYRVVAADSRKARNGRFIEIVGTYNPRQEPSLIEIDNERALHWLRHGAQPSERVQKLLVISGAWEEFTGEAAPAASAPAKVTTAASAEVDVAASEEAEQAEASVSSEEVEQAEADESPDEDAERADAVSEVEQAEADERPDEDAERAEDEES